VGVFYGCQKEELLKEPQTTTTSFKEDPKLFDDAKAYFTSKYGKTNTILPQTNLVSNAAQSGVSIAVTPVWNEATVSAYLKTNSILIVPIENVDAFNVGTTSYNLVFYRDSLGKIQSKLNISVPDSSYAVTHSQSNVTDFTGCFFQMDMQGKMGNLLRVKDGKFTKKGQITFGNSVKSNPLQTRDECDDGGPDCPSPAGRRRSWLAVVFDAIGDAISWVFSGTGTSSSGTVGNFGFGGNNFGDGGGGIEGSNTNGGGSTNTGNSTTGTNLLADEVGNQIFDMTDERATLMYIHYRLNLDYGQTQFLRINREIALQIQDYLMGHDNTQGHMYAKVHLSLLTENPDYKIYNQQLGYLVSLINTLGRYVDLGFSGQEFGYVILNSSLYAQVDSKIDKPNFMHGEGWTLGKTCAETFLYVKVGDGYTTNVKEISHGYLKWLSYFYYCIPNMCVQVRGKDQFGQPLTAEKASELSAYAMDNARLEVMEDIGSLIRTSEEAKQLFKTYFQEELVKLTGGRATCSISYGTCSGNIPGEFVYMKSILTAMDCIQIRCH
jgi:hypothetical protein